MAHCLQILLKVVFLTLLASLSHAQSDSNSLHGKTLENGLVCITDRADEESANSFLLQGDGESILVDAGWSDKANVPIDIAKAIAKAQKVSTHFHFDHIRQLYKMKNIILTKQQADLCIEGMCTPSRWQTAMKVKAFKFTHEISDAPSTKSLNPRLISISCYGHSQTDACFLDRRTRTLFLGDLFYLGPVFYFLPGGNVDLVIRSLENFLARDDWDHLALSHGECISNRAKLVGFVGDLKEISAGKLSWSVNFDFWLPLRAYKVRSGYVVTNLFW